MSALGDDALQELLSAFALHGEEAAVLKHLLRGGPSTATDLSRLAHVNRATMYKLLRDLAAKGLVREIPQRPILYKAVEVQEAMTRAAQEAQARVERLVDLALRAPAASEASQRRGWMQAEDVSLLVGRAAVHREMQRLVLDAQSHVALCGSDEFGKRIAASDDLVWCLQQAVKANRVVRLMLPNLDSAHVGLLERALAGGTLHRLRSPWPASIVWVCNESAALLVVVQPPDHTPSQGSDLGIRLESRDAAAHFAAVLSQLQGVSLEPPRLGLPDGGAPGHT